MKGHDPAPRPASSNAKWIRVIAVVSVYGALLSLGYWGGGWLTSALGIDHDQGKFLVNDRKVWLNIAVYALLLAIPFVPGIEISIALLSTLGTAVAVQIYLATVVAFTLSFMIGRLVPAALLMAFFRLVSLTSAEALMKRLQPLSRKERLSLLVEHAPSRFIPLLLRFRYVALVAAFNLPGNAILGGGGGIALLAGLSGMYSLPQYLIAASVAALPIPAVALLVGHVF